MPAFDFLVRKYNYEQKEYEIIYKGLCPTLEFWKNLKIKKSQRDFKCVCCNKRKPKGTKYIGNSWERICFLCFEEWVETSKGTLTDIKKKFNGILKELKDNKEKWERELIINNL